MLPDVIRRIQLSVFGVLAHVAGKTNAIFTETHSTTILRPRIRDLNIILMTARSRTI
jgi:hypothetical protein